VLLSNDDPVVKVELVPHGDLLRNRNCVLVEANRGGHCDFFCKVDGQYRRYWVEIMMLYLDSMLDYQTNNS
jgi:predicted alpha/beta-fold hydrolase